MLSTLLNLIDVNLLWYCGYALCAIAVLFIIAWFFSPMRSFCGALILAVIAALAAYRKGELDQKHRDADRQARESEPRQEFNPFDWLQWGRQ